MMLNLKGKPKSNAYGPAWDFRVGWWNVDYDNVAVYGIQFYCSWFMFELVYRRRLR